MKKELNDESNNGKTIEESNSEASSSDEDCDDPNDPDVENSSEMKKQLASLEDNEFCGRDSGCTCILALYQVSQNTPYPSMTDHRSMYLSFSFEIILILFFH